MRSNLFRSGLVVAALVLLGRVAGFGRELLLASFGGASAHTDLAIVLLTLPDLLVNLLLGGGLTATLVPAFQAQAQPQRSALVLQVSVLLVGLFGLVALLLSCFPGQAVGVLAPGLIRTIRHGGENALGLSSLAIPLTAASGAVVALLNSNGRFAVGASGTMIFNLSIILALLFVPRAFGSDALLGAIALGVAFGALLRLVIQVLGLVQDWKPPVWPKNPLLTPGLLRQFGGNFGFVTALVLLPPIARGLASSSDPGGLSLFNYATKLVDLPMGVVMGSLTTVLLPRLSADLASGDQARRHRSLALGLRATVVTSLIIAVPAVICSLPLAKFVYARAAFSAIQFHQLGMATRIGFCFLLPQALVVFWGAVFAAQRQTKPLLIIGVLMVAALSAMGPIFAKYGGLPGVMSAVGIAYSVAALLLSGLILRLYGLTPFLQALRGAPAIPEPMS